MIMSVVGLKPMWSLSTTSIYQLNKGPLSYQLSHSDLHFGKLELQTMRSAAFNIKLAATDIANNLQCHQHPARWQYYYTTMQTENRHSAIISYHFLQQKVTFLATDNRALLRISTLLSCIFFSAWP